MLQNFPVLYINKLTKFWQNTFPFATVFKEIIAIYTEIIYIKPCTCTESSTSWMHSVVKNMTRAPHKIYLGIFFQHSCFNGIVLPNVHSCIVNTKPNTVNLGDFIFGHFFISLFKDSSCCNSILTWSKAHIK